MVLFGFPTPRRTRHVRGADRGDRGRARSSRSRSCRCTRPTRCAAASPTTTSTCSMLVPGVGKRTAQRLLIELKARLEVPDLDLADAGAAAPTPRGEVRDALVGPRLLARRGARRARRSSPTTAPSRTCSATRCECWRDRDDGVREELLEPGRPIPRRGGRGDDAAAAAARRVRRPAAPARAPRDHAHRGPPARAGRRPRAVRRPARARQDDARRDHRHRDGRAHAATSGPALERAGDLAAILTNLDDGGVLFIDEIHRLAARGRRGAVSRDGGLPARHRDRQGSVGAHDPPRPAALHARRRDHAHRARSPVRCATGSASSPGSTTTRSTSSRRSCARAAQILGVELDAEGASEIASPEPGHAAHREPVAEAGARLRRGARRRHGRRSTPRAPRCALFEVDELGLDKVDRAILGALCRTFAGRAVGLGTLAVAVGEAPETVEDVYEPFLLQCGLLERTPRGPGRDAGRASLHLGLHEPSAPGEAPNLF